MRRMWVGMIGFITLWCGGSGCQTTEPNLKPDLPAEYVLPPENDLRYSGPAGYPKETLNNGPLKRSNPAQPGGPPRGPGRMGGPGMGGF